ncbi:MAG TPA: hypothetical protein VJQ57_14165 [Acidimicrobiia bacterium]|nr:hypothetical protein [Acidimicrobiia bacterium]
MRRWVAFGGTFLMVFALALPARAGLGDLLGGLLEDPIAEVTEPLAPLVTSVPLVEDLIETTEALTAPVVTVVDQLASPLVTVVEEVVSPIVEPVEEVVSPIVDPEEEVVDPEVIEPSLDPVTNILEPVLDVPPAPTVEPTVPVLNSTTTSTRFEIVELTFDQAPIPTPADAESTRSAPSTETISIQRALLASISGLSLSWQDREGNDPVAGNIDWLSALRGWLQSGVAALLDVLAIPARLFEILLRALLSAGSGLVAPAAILVSLAVGGRRRLLPVS